jgi:glutamate-ammonia-ligase adenylyltransferase
MESEAGPRRIEALKVASRSLAALVDDDPNARAAVVDEGPLPDRAGYLEAARAALAEGDMGGLRLFKRRALAALAGRDLAGEIGPEIAGLRLAELADATLEVALDHLHAPESLAVIAMGKLGGLELNYSSDIDVMFVAAADEVAASIRVVEDLLHELGGVAPEGQAYRIDVNLRPEGRNGALVRSLDGYLEYYKRWAEAWEFQALIKARASAGAVELGDEFVQRTRDLVYPSDVSSEVIQSIRKMKERVEEHAQRSARKARSSEADDVKLGPGGIRDIEFSVQLLQLVHGGSDPSVRSANTLEAITSLIDGGYIAEEDGAGLSVDYRWLRNVEHRVQLWQERQVHLLPRDPDARKRVAIAMGFRDSPDMSSLERFDDAHHRVLSDVRGRFEKLFYRPMVEALADATGPRMSRDALKERLRVLGFRDVERASRTLEGLVSGTSRRAKLFRVLTPALLRFLTTTPQPDEGLFAFLRLGEALEGRLDVLGSLRDNPPGLEFLAHVLGSGRLLGEVLMHVPEELATIADPRGPGDPKPRERLVHEAMASLNWRDPEDRRDGLRRFKRREMLRVALSDLSGASDFEATGRWLSDLAEACLEAALKEVGAPLAVVGMGKLGGRELAYPSDVDVMFVGEGDPTEMERAAEELLRSIGEITPEGQAFRVDAAIRPEGKSGPLVRSLDSYLEYYRRWSRPWEHQALIKARAAAGDLALAEKLVDATRDIAFPEVVSDEAWAEIRHLKARMERERVPRGVDARRHLKMGPGGLADVEFSVQVLQLRHGIDIEGLRSPNTMEALDAATLAGLLDEDSAQRLRESYLLLSEIRNKLFLHRGRPTDVVPTKPEELEALGIGLGFTDQPRQEAEESYLRATRRARKVAEKLIYG